MKLSEIFLMMKPSDFFWIFLMLKPSEIPTMPMVSTRNEMQRPRDTRRLSHEEQKHLMGSYSTKRFLSRALLTKETVFPETCVQLATSIKSRSVAEKSQSFSSIAVAPLIGAQARTLLRPPAEKGTGRWHPLQSQNMIAMHRNTGSSVQAPFQVQVLRTQNSNRRSFH